jgi:hypothetical protein
VYQYAGESKKALIRQRQTIIPFSITAGAVDTGHARPAGSEKCNRHAVIISATNGECFFHRIFNMAANSRSNGVS